MLIPKKWWALTVLFISAWTAQYILAHSFYHKLVILTDAGPGESQYNSSTGFLTQKLRDSLEQHNTPLLVSGVVLDTFFSFAQKWDNQHPYNPPPYLYHDAYKALENNKWRIFKIFNSDLYALIPLESSLNNCGLKLTQKNLCQELILGELMLELQKRWHIAKFDARPIHEIFADRNINISELKKIFVKDSIPWLIYWSGHGWYHEEKYIKNNSLDPQARFCGLSLKNAQAFVRFLGNTLTVDALCYDTCYGGSYNAEIICKTVSNTANPFVLISNASSDALKYGMGKNNYGLFFDTLNKNFAKLKLLDEKQVKTKKTQQFLRKIIEPAAGLLPRDFDHAQGPGSSADYYNIASRLAFIHIPDWKNWRPVSLHNPITAVDETLSDKKPLVVYDNFAVVLQTETIEQPLIIKQDRQEYAPTLLSVNPAITTHKFSSIEAQDINLQELMHACTQVNTASCKNFTIDQLVCNNFKGSKLPGKKLYLEDIIIHRKPKINEQSRAIEGIEGTALFKIANKNNWYMLKQENNNPSAYSCSALSYAQANKFKQEFASA